MIDPTAAKSIFGQPLTQDDIGKTMEEINLARIYAYLKEQGQIVI